MTKVRNLPEAILVDDAGNTYQRQHLSGSDLDLTGLGVDGQERISYSSASFDQGPESSFDEFH